MKCLGLYCLRDVNQARAHILFFLSLLESDNTELCKASLSLLFDFLMYFGPTALGDTFNDEPENISEKERARIAKERARQRRKSARAKKRLEIARAEDSDLEGEPEDNMAVELDESKKGKFFFFFGNLLNCR